MESLTIQNAVNTYILSLSYFAFVPVLESTAWALADYSRAARNALETLGDAVLYEVLVELLLWLFPDLNTHILDLLRQVITSNATLLHVLYNVGVYKTLAFHKAAGNAFEIIVGVMFEAVGWPAVAGWLESLFTPIIYAALDAAILSDSIQTEFRLRKIFFQPPAPKRRKR
ncbi:hypothetical protein FB451DRAFT_1410994 [Mycena latifolia]|nr:hypothetical protein FB451DRAFT_1410994 [Mycena latifolia]